MKTRTVKLSPLEQKIEAAAALVRSLPQMSEEWEAAFNTLRELRMQLPAVKPAADVPQHVFIKKYYGNGK